MGGRFSNDRLFPRPIPSRWQLSGQRQLQPATGNQPSYLPLGRKTNRVYPDQLPFWRSRRLCRQKLGRCWRQDRYIHNRNYIFSIIRLIERNKGDLKVIYDLGAEHANTRLENNGSVDSNLHRRFCGSLWAAFCNEFGPQNSMAYSCITQFGQARYGRVPLGLVYMMDLFAKDKLPFPGYYGIDTYDTPYVKPPVNNPVYAVLVDTHDFLKKNYPGEELKPCILQESFYNDATVARQIEQALADRPGIRLQSVFQWPKVRGHEKTFFPDIYPKNF